MSADAHDTLLVRRPRTGVDAHVESTRPLRVVLDCDPGIDDAMAIFYGLLSADIEIVAVCTTWGNAHVGSTTTNALQLLELAGCPDVPVAMGAARPLVGSARHLGDGPHGANGLGDVELPAPHGAPIAEAAAIQLVRLARRYPGELTLVAIGPLTNLALAVMLAPDLPRLYRSVVIMGGAFLTPGNFNSVAETNIGHDPEAAQIVFDGDWPITLVGLDVTERVRVGQSSFDDLRDHAGRLGQQIYRMSARYLSFYERRDGRRECPIHDALALGIAADPSLIRSSRRTRVDVELSGGHTRGMTVAELRSDRPTEHGNVTIVLDVDGSRFIDHWMRTFPRFG